MKFSKKESKSEELVRHVFEYYRICKFRLKSSQLFEVLFPSSNCDIIQRMEIFVNLVEAFLEQMPKDQKEILLFIYYDLKTYHDTHYSQSAFFTLKKVAVNNFFELLQQTVDLKELSQLIGKEFKND